MEPPVDQMTDMTLRSTAARLIQTPAVWAAVKGSFLLFFGILSIIYVSDVKTILKKVNSRSLRIKLTDKCV